MMEVENNETYGCVAGAIKNLRARRYGCLSRAPFFLSPTTSKRLDLKRSCLKRCCLSVLLCGYFTFQYMGTTC